MFSAHSRLRHAVADTFAMVVYCTVVNMMIEIFQSPVYVAILWSVGADWHQIVAAVSSNLAVSMMMGAAYGYFLDYCRRLFRVAPYQQAKA